MNSWRGIFSHHDILTTKQIIKLGGIYLSPEIYPKMKATTTCTMFIHTLFEWTWEVHTYKECDSYSKYWENK